MNNSHRLILSIENHHKVISYECECGEFKTTITKATILNSNNPIEKVTRQYLQHLEEIKNGEEKRSEF